jgi:hypothetical protein
MNPDTTPLDAILESIEDASLITNMCDMAERLNSTTANLRSLRAVIATHGLTQSLEALIGAELSLLCPDHANHDLAANLANIDATVESIMAKIANIVYTLIEAIKRFINRFVYNINQALMHLAYTIKKVNAYPIKTFPPEPLVLDITKLKHEDLVNIVHGLSWDAFEIVERLNKKTWQNTKVEFPNFSDNAIEAKIVQLTDTERNYIEAAPDTYINDCSEMHKKYLTLKGELDTAFKRLKYNRSFIPEPKDTEYDPIYMLRTINNLLLLCSKRLFLNIQHRIKVLNSIQPAVDPTK